MKNLAIIPARGGSKTIHLKNIKLINKKPLIYFTIEAALKSKIFDYVIISTDSKLIKKKCNKYKNILIFNRDKKISGDKSRTEETVYDVLKKIKIMKNYYPDWIYILEPTSPLRTVKTIINVKNILKKAKFNSLLTIKKIGNVPGILKNNRLKYIQKRISRRQERKNFYEESSTLYCVKYKYFMKQKEIVEKSPYTFLVEKEESIDINDMKDFHIASLMLKSKKKNAI